MNALAPSREFWLSVCEDTRRHQIREYLLWRHNPRLKKYHRAVALEWARRLRELLK